MTKTLMAACCPTCGRTLPKPKPANLSAVPTADPATMTDAELYVYYKRSALVMDLSFFLNVGPLSPELRARGLAITKPTSKDLAELRAAWRAERNAADRAAGVPALGSPEWAAALNTAAELESVAAS